MSHFTKLKIEPLSSEAVEDFMNFVNRNRFLKMSSKIMEIPSIEDKYPDLLVTMHDIRVFCRGPDDSIYASTNDNKVPENAKIRELITRGCMLVNVKDNQTGEDIYWNLFQGLCKFSGMTEEDDDDISKMNEMKDRKRIETTIRDTLLLEETFGQDGISLKINDIKRESKSLPWINSQKKDPFFLLPFTSATKFINTRKENGKACHFAAFEIEYQSEKLRFYISGSKNVHVVFRNEMDIPHDSMILHHQAARAMLSLLKSIDTENAHIFESMLVQTGLVANFEFMLPDDQHIVDYQLEEPLARFLTFSGRRIENDDYVNVYGKCINPKDAISWVESLGVPITAVCEEYEFSTENLRKLIENIRPEEMSEGSVIYFVKDNQVIGLWKLKSQWYILYRAIREKIVRIPNDFNQLMKKRINAIRQWIGLTNEEVLKWRFIAAKLFEFHIELMKKDSLTYETIRGSYAETLRKFLSEFNLPDDLDEVEFQKEYTVHHYRKIKESSQSVGNPNTTSKKKKRKRKHKKR